MRSVRERENVAVGYVMMGGHDSYQTTTLQGSTHAEAAPISRSDLVPTKKHIGGEAERGRDVKGLGLQVVGLCAG